MFGQEKIWLTISGWHWMTKRSNLPIVPLSASCTNAVLSSHKRNASIEILKAASSTMARGQKSCQCPGTENGTILTEKLNPHLPEYCGIRLDSGEYSDLKAKSCDLISTRREEMRRRQSVVNGWMVQRQRNSLVVVNSYEKWSVLLRDDVEWKRGLRRNESKEGWSCGFNDTERDLLVVSCCG
jgi:hypothetical protein